MDLFASEANTQLPRFISGTLTLAAAGVEALQCPWVQGLLYAFPPVQLLSPFLCKVRQQGTQVILIAPWFVEIIRLEEGPGWQLPKESLSAGTLPTPSTSSFLVNRMGLERRALERKEYASQGYGYLDGILEVIHRKIICLNMEEV